MTSLIAEFGMVFGFVLIVVLVMIVVAAGVFELLVRVCRSIFRGLFGDATRGAVSRNERVCQNPGCGHENLAKAVFCGQCGERLS